MDESNQRLDIYQAATGAAFDDYPSDPRSESINANSYYHRRIDKIPLLSDEQTASLAKVVQSGKSAQTLLAKELSGEARSLVIDQLSEEIKTGDTARWKLVNGHLRFGAHVARLTMGWKPFGDEMMKSNGRYVFRGARIKNLSRFASAPMPYEDRIQIATQALYDAAGNYRTGRGAKFTTYAGWYIEEAIERAIGDDTTIRVPTHIQEQINKVENNLYRITQQLGRLPLRGELAEAVGLVEYDLEFALRAQALRQSDSLEKLNEQSFDEEGELKLLDLPSGSINSFSADTVDPFERDQSREDYINELLGLLRERYADVIRLRYGLNGEDPMTLESVGHVLDITRERVRQIENKALEAMLNVNYFDSFWWRLKDTPMLSYIQKREYYDCRYALKSCSGFGVPVDEIMSRHGSAAWADKFLDF